MGTEPELLKYLKMHLLPPVTTLPFYIIRRSKARTSGGAIAEQICKKSDIQN